MLRTCVFVLLGLPALAGCGYIPLYSYHNVELKEPLLTVPRPVENVYRALSLRPQLTGVPSGVDKASLVKELCGMGSKTPSMSHRAWTRHRW